MPVYGREEKPLFVFNFMDFVFIARDHMRMYLMATRPHFDDEESLQTFVGCRC